MKGYECTKILIAVLRIGWKGLRIHKARVAVNLKIVFCLFSTMNTLKKLNKEKQSKTKKRQVTCFRKLNRECISVLHPVDSVMNKSLILTSVCVFKILCNILLCFCHKLMEVLIPSNYQAANESSASTYFFLNLRTCKELCTELAWLMTLLFQ